jgi:hypothetical protein
MPACPCACRSGWTALLSLGRSVRARGSECHILPPLAAGSRCKTSPAECYEGAVCADVRVKSDGSATPHRGHKLAGILRITEASGEQCTTPCPLSCSPPCCSIARVACLISPCSHADPALLCVPRWRSFPLLAPACLPYRGLPYRGSAPLVRKYCGRERRLQRTITVCKCVGPWVSCRQIEAAGLQLLSGVFAPVRPPSLPRVVCCPPCAIPPRCVMDAPSVRARVLCACAVVWVRRLRVAFLNLLPNSCLWCVAVSCAVAGSLEAPGYW